MERNFDFTGKFIKADGKKLTKFDMVWELQHTKGGFYKYKYWEDTASFEKVKNEYTIAIGLGLIK